MREPYGILYSAFWDGDTGTQLQLRGKDAVLLAAFLTANRAANMIGLYELPVSKIERTLTVFGGRGAVRRALIAITEVGYADYDLGTEFVWVREMARIRLNLESGKPLKRGDNRQVGAVKIYESLPINPFLGPFFDRYAPTLLLPRRREGPLPTPPKGASQGDTEGPSEGDRQGAHEGASEASNQRSGTSTSGIRNQESEIRDQKSGIRDQGSEQRAAAAPRLPLLGLALTADQRDHLTREPNDDNYHPIHALACELLAEGPNRYDDIGAFTDGLKWACAQRRIDYGREVASDVVHRAAASAWCQLLAGLLQRRA